MKFTGKIEKGCVKFHDKKGFKDYISKIDGEVWIDIRKAPKARSPQQNAYYRHIIRQIGGHLGYPEDEMHDVIKHKFEITSTKELDAEEFSELLDRIIRFAAEYGFIVQDPRRT